jgi:rifampicin phosphotransferase
MTLTSIDLVLPLDEVGSADALRVGHKAATLGALKRAGFPVPEGVVLTTEALARTMAAAGLDAAAGPDQVAAAPLVAAEAAGVAFSADPVTGDRDAAVVNAVSGLGDRLVAGRASPDEWVVRGVAATCRAAPEGAVNAEVAAEVAALARRVEARLGTPQDIEWALAGGELVLLQARPITALPDQAPAPVPVPVEVPPGFWEREASHAPKPWTPMTLSTLAEARDWAMRRTFAEFGLLAETLECAQIGGWEYTRLVPLGGKDRPAPPARLMPLLIRLVPRLRRRIADAVAAVRSDKAGRFLEQRYQQWQPDLAARSALLRHTDLGALDDEELDAHTARALALLHEGVDVHFLLHGALMPILAELAFACRGAARVVRRGGGLRAAGRPVDHLHRARPPAGRAGQDGRAAVRGAPPAGRGRRRHRRPAGRS